MSVGSRPRTQVVERLTGLLGLALYALLVSRGELLPYTGAARTLTVALVAMGLTALVVWRLRPWLTGRAVRTVLWGVAPVCLVLLLALLLRIAAGAFGRPVEPGEARVLSAAIQVIAAAPLDAGDALTVALGWLHAPLAAFVYMHGASAGRWREIENVSPESLLVWSRAFQLSLSLGTLGVVYLAGRRLAAPRVALLAMGLLAVSSASIATATHIDAAAPASLLASLALLALPPLVVAHLRRLPRSAQVVGAVLALSVLWLPVFAAALAAPWLALLTAVLVTHAARRGRQQGSAQPRSEDGRPWLA